MLRKAVSSFKGKVVALINECLCVLTVSWKLGCFSSYGLNCDYRPIHSVCITIILPDHLSSEEVYPRPIQSGSLWRHHWVGGCVVGGHD